VDRQSGRNDAPEAKKNKDQQAQIAVNKGYNFVSVAAPSLARFARTVAFC
jgi:hypothetical protein